MIKFTHPHTHTQTYTDRHAQLHKHSHTHTHTQPHTHIATHTYTATHTHIHTHTDTPARKMTYPLLHLRPDRPSFLCAGLCRWSGIFRKVLDCVSTRRCSRRDLFGRSWCISVPDRNTWPQKPSARGTLGYKIWGGVIVTMKTRPDTRHKMRLVRVWK